MWWTTEQVAEHAGMTVEQVYESRRRKEWPGVLGVRQGRSLRYDSELVKAGPRAAEHSDDAAVVAVWLLEDIRNLARDIRSAVEEVRAWTRQQQDRPLLDIDTCGVVRGIDDGPDHWVVACTQDEHHGGPHVGFVSWLNDERAEDE